MNENPPSPKLPNENAPSQNPPGKPFLQVESLSAGYGTQTILHDLTFTLRAGESLGIAGTSGTGKSTLALALLGLLPHRGGWARGRVLLDGQDLLALPEREARTLRGRTVALVPQSPLSALNPAVSLRRHFDEAWRAHQPTGRAAGKSGLDARLATLLPEVQLPFDPGFLARRPGAVSVGQAQRIVLALALLHRPALLLADEPTSALDPVTQTEIIALLRTLIARHHTALLYISHDLLSALQVCDQLAILDHGSLVERLPIAALGTQPHHPALAALLGTLPAPPQILRGFRSLHPSG